MNESDQATTQAPLPSDADAVRPVAVGTGLWVLAWIVLVTQRSWLDANDAAWWLWVPPAAVALGVVGLVVTTRRRSRRP